MVNSKQLAKLLLVVIAIAGLTFGLTANFVSADNSVATLTMNGYDEYSNSKCGEGKCGGDSDKSAKESKCGEGKCGEDKSHDKKCDRKCCEDKKRDKNCEGKCGEGKCGEGKCGGDDAKTSAKEKAADVKEAVKEAKCGEGKCGEGKCG